MNYTLSHIDRPRFLPLFVIVWALFCACSSSSKAADPVELRADSGSTLHQHAAYLYVIGGYKADGSASPDIYSASLGADGELGDWSLAGSLPEGRAHAAALSFGDKLYVLGGEDDSGPVDTVYLMSVVSDGKLSWVNLYTSDRPSGDRLPEARSRMAAALCDGRAFLIGGRLASGALSSSIIHARFYADGMVGDWYPAQAQLSEAKEDASAELSYAEDGSACLFVAGGRNANACSDKAERFAVGLCGLLSASSPIPEMPLPLAKPILVSDGESTVVAGGFSGDSLLSTAVFRYQSSGWAEIEGAAFSAVGPGRARVAGEILGLCPPVQATEAWGIHSISGLVSTPEPPSVHPGSGMVPAGSLIQVRSAPSDTLRFLSASGVVSAAAPTWPSAAQQLSASSLFGFEAFSALGLSSGQVTRDWEVSRNGLVPVYDPISFGERKDFAAGWYRLVSAARSNVELAWSGGGFTVYEYDQNTWALDTNGVPVRYPFSSAVQDMILLYLSADKYYLYCDPDTTDGTMTISIGSPVF